MKSLLSRIKPAIESRLLRLWYGDSAIGNLIAILLSPLSLLYGWISNRIANAAKEQAMPVEDSHVKVIVVGNITVGGTGKTPFLIALVKYLQSYGFSPAVISRGHGGSYLQDNPVATAVNANSDPAVYGDEPVLIAQSLEGVPVVVCPQRAEAVKFIQRDFLSNNKLSNNTLSNNKLSSHNPSDDKQYNVIVSDDGLQHYALRRDIEIVLVDASRGFGNERLLPAGPLREPIARLASIDQLVFTGQPSTALNNLVAQWLPSDCIASIEQQISGARLLAVQRYPDLPRDYNRDATARQLSRYQQLYLMTGIGNPDRFFDAIERLLASELPNQTRPTTHCYRFPDHHRFTIADFQAVASQVVPQAAPQVEAQNTEPHGVSAIVITAKDAVKCASFAAQVDLPIFVIDVEVTLDESTGQSILQLVNA